MPYSYRITFNEAYGEWWVVEVGGDGECVSAHELYADAKAALAADGFGCRCGEEHPDNVYSDNGETVVGDTNGNKR